MKKKEVDEMEELISDELEIIVGTYEEFVLGYKFKGGGGKDKKMELSFTNHSHSASIRSLGVVGRYLVSGSADESIRLINMSTRKEHGYLQQQEGTITCLTNYGTKYLFSGCVDGTICIWRSGNWICEKTLKAHNGGVNDISVHPSGKLALSVGMDRSLKTWNLIKGRTGFVTNLHGIGEIVRWSPEGNYYAVGISNRLDIYSVATAKVIYSVPFGKRVDCIVFPKEDIVVLGGDKDLIEVHDIKGSKKLSEFKGHRVRVKDMKFIRRHSLLITGSNCDQHVKMWKFEDESFSKAPVLFAQHDTTCRITRLTAWSRNISKDGEESDSEDEHKESEEMEAADEDEEEVADEEETEKPKPKKKVVQKKSSVTSSKPKQKMPSNMNDADAPKKKKKKLK